MYTSKKLTAAAAVLISLGTIALSAATAIPAAAQGPAAPFAGERGQNRERHPELRRALASLERTETQLRKSNRDFGGHREKAAALCHQAEQEIQQALQEEKH